MSLADRHLSHRLAAKYGTGDRLGWQSAVYHQSEKILVDRLANVLKIKDEDVKKAFVAVEEMKEAYVKFSNFVFQ